MAASLFVDGEVVGYPCLAVVLQSLTFKFLLGHIFVSLDWRAQAKGVGDVEGEVVFHGHLSGVFNAACDLVIDPGFGFGGGFGVGFLCSTWRGSACLRVNDVVSSQARFGPGVVACLVAKDTLERAVTFARDAVSARALVVVIFH